MTPEEARAWPDSEVYRRLLVEQRAEDALMQATYQNGMKTPGPFTEPKA